MKEALMYTDIPDVTLFARGKVRDVYDIGDKLLIVATDRISAFDCVMPNGIPGKGKILTEMSLFWFDYVSDIVPNHLITSSVDKYPTEIAPYRDQLEGCSMLVRKAERIDIECIVRGYISGSGWREYQKTGAISGIKLPSGLVESQRLPETIFTPSTKAETGHDENVNFNFVVNMIGEERATEIREIAIAVYEKARAYAEMRGIILADTKFEFGRVDGRTILIDEILSPDSSRFWPVKEYNPGGSQPSFDKQFVRDYLDSLNWNKTPPAPELPEEIVAKTLDKYSEARDLLIK
ncbi:MAG: phosphoribosylaminoimidazolesuccinocarboxamide synthase [Candidatus Latescibacteria bacterium]|jgi:phosphoribosylaminoimidazole-succinocarboxamide synthase|nr:phosphoribosylaminoimidazolesuccinocarboxamide synthase [Candidatus Latescibacterota bacterium]